MPVGLIPPTTYSGAIWDGTSTPLTEAPRYMRGRLHSRWHRPRSGTVYATFTSVHFWCGQGARLEGLIGTDEVPVDDQACGTCEGRALGAGRDPLPDGMPDLLFTPYGTKPPAFCPGSAPGLFAAAGPRVGRCLACGVLEPVRAKGSPYNPSVGLVRHRPGADLISACPWHGWRRITKRKDGTAGCACGYRPEVTR